MMLGFKEACLRAGFVQNLEKHENSKAQYLTDAPILNPEALVEGKTQITTSRAASSQRRNLSNQSCDFGDWG